MNKKLKAKAFCLNCNKEFEYYKSNSKGKFCSMQCYSKFLENKRHIIKCLTCGKEMKVAEWESDRKYCSRKCADKGHEKNYKYICKTCGVEFISKSKHAKCCSVQCGAIQGNIAAKKKLKYTNTRPEKEFETLLKQEGIKYTKQKMVEWKHGWKKFYDFYIVDKNILIEIDGAYWHGLNLKYDQLNDQQRQTRDNDIIKNQLAIDRDYKLIRIWENEIQTFNINQIK